MEFNTVDGFQGREVDILILTTVRSSISDSGSTGTSSIGIGFVADIRRMNVALTRAKLSLWIVGNARTLQINPHWAALVQNAKERNLFISVSRPYDSFLERTESVSGGNSRSSRADFRPTNGKRNEGAKSSRGAEEGKNGDGDAHRKKTKFAGGVPLVRTIKKSGPGSYEGNKRVEKHKKNKFSVTDATETLDAEAIKLQKQQEGSTSSGNSAQKNPEGSRGGTKVIPENVQLRTDSHVKTVMKDKVVKKFSGQASPSKPRKDTTSLLSSERSSQREGNREKSKPSCVRTTTKDLLAARKRQRDDIEALLPSALISSKKTGVSSNTATIKKPPPCNN